MGYIYCFVFPNGKRYVGATTEEKINNRWQNGRNYKGKVREAIKEFGWCNVTKYYWEVPDSQLDDTERFLINLYKTMCQEFGYNTRDGGKKGYHQQEETRKKQSEALKGEKCYMYGIPKSEEIKEKLRKNHLGQTPWNKGVPQTEEHRRKNSESHKGIKPSEEARRNMSEAQRLRWAKKKGLA